jgi:hypothetical protein
MERELYIVQGEWIVKRRNCAATFNNRAGAILDRRSLLTSFLFLLLFKTLLAKIIDLIFGVKSCLQLLKLNFFNFLGKDAAKHLLFGHTKVVLKKVNDLFIVQ